MDVEKSFDWEGRIKTDLANYLIEYDHLYR